MLQLADKLQYHTKMLQPASQSSEESIHKTMKAYMRNPACITQKESNLTTTMF